MHRFVSIQLDRNLDKPLYIQLYEGIIDLISQGKLSPEEKLPPIRKLAALLKVNSVTVVNAYRLLEKEGYAVSKVGSGTYVSPAIISAGRPALKLQPHSRGAGTPDIDPRSKALNPKNAPFSTGGPDGSLGFSGAERQNPGARVRFDFGSAAISPEFFPVDDFKEVLNEVLDRDGGYAFDYQESMGYPPLRQSIRDFIFKEYGIEMPVDGIQVVSGAQQGIDIIAKAFLNFQDTVFVEAPTYTGAIDAFRSRGARIVEIPMERDGVNLDEFVSKLKNRPPKLFYTMPNFHNPTGRSYSAQKKKELLALTSEYDFLIVEDDHMNDLYFAKKPEPLKALDRSGRVLYIKSFSKLFMPGLRLAFIASPEGFAGRITDAKYSSDISSSGLTQRALDLFFRKSLWTGHVNRIRKAFREKWQIMKYALEEYLPGCIEYTDPGGGLFFWLVLPRGYYSMNLYTEALKRGLLIMPGDLFYADRRPSQGFRLSFAEISPEDIQGGIKLLSEIISDFLEEYSLSPIRGTGYRPLL
ncbi:PLP-dependent aminotransferase family protein [Thermoanaerobacterium sp. DL9XJH110]|uniref:MocR-like pyridoxine biosynthesis transcription factor PdxR n=1 Tax=Thermoanaerobacterium sp. DL9XJH110 TaxID=3386643 RepID=UPI003BB4FCDE